MRFSMSKNKLSGAGVGEFHYSIIANEIPDGKNVFKDDHICVFYENVVFSYDPDGRTDLCISFSENSLGNRYKIDLENFLVNDIFVDLADNLQRDYVCVNVINSVVEDFFTKSIPLDVEDEVIVFKNSNVNGIDLEYSVAKNIRHLLIDKVV